jgi:hypothetical protein
MNRSMLLILIFFFVLFFIVLIYQGQMDCNPPNLPCGIAPCPQDCSATEMTKKDIATFVCYVSLGGMVVSTIAIAVQKFKNRPV